MSIYRLQRWIHWREIERPRADGTLKKDKVPWSYRTNGEINAHDPAQWMSYDDAARAGHPMGFVFTVSDPYFFLDLDRCRQGEGWRPEAERIAAMFPGAAMEVSTSTNGLHIVGRCDKLLTVNLRNKFGKDIAPDLGLWCEFYTTGRFMALGHGFNDGDFDRDFTSVLLQLVPQRENDDEVIETSGPVPEYTGPTDDDELIRKASASRSAAAAFGAKASFEHLFNASTYADMMAQHFPSPTGDVFDRSSADAALMAHLAFWTGKDAERMDRIFRRSDLMRPKYAERPNYRKSTIAGAIRGTRKVYDRIVEDEDAGGPDVTALDEYLTTTQQQAHFAGCVYVRDDHRIMIPGGDLVPPAAFKAIYGGHTFQMTADGSGPTRNAFEAFTENRAFHFPKVARTCFRPEATPGAIIDNMVNVYQPYHCVARSGDVTPFLTHIRKLFPVGRDADILMAYLAALVQNPGKKFRWAPVIQGVKGNGKSFIANCVEYIVGPRYSHKPSANDLKNPFNSYLENKLLIVVEEIHVEGRRDLLDMMKPLITDERIETQPKGIDKRMIDNRTNWIFFSNHKDAIPIDKDERRYAPFFTFQQTYAAMLQDGLTNDYFVKLFEWAHGGGFAIIADYLLNYQVPDELNPARWLNRAPETSNTRAAVEMSKGRAEQEIEEAIINGEPGFRGGWVSSHAATAVLKEAGIRLSTFKVAEIIESMGYTSVGRSSQLIMQENKRPIMYCLNELYRPGLDHRDYMKAQGYISADAAMANVVALDRTRRT